MIAKELTKAKPGAWRCVQTREMLSTDEQVRLRPGHHWLFEFGDGGEGSSCEKLFSLPQRRTGVVYKGTRFYNGDRALRVKRWLHRVDEDAAGLTFEEWDPIKDADDSQTPVPMIINSSELRGAGFNLQEVIPPALEVAARSGRLTRGAGLRQLEVIGRMTFVLTTDDDNELRSRCEWVPTRIVYTIQISFLCVQSLLNIVSCPFCCDFLNLSYLKSGQFFQKKNQKKPRSPLVGLAPFACLHGCWMPMTVEIVLCRGKL